MRNRNGSQRLEGKKETAERTVEVKFSKKLVARQMPFLTGEEEKVVRMIHGVRLDPDSPLELKDGGKELQAIEAEIWKKIRERKKGEDHRLSVKKKIIARLKEMRDK